MVHITEEDAARDFAAVMQHIRLGDEVRLDCKDGMRAVLRKADDQKPVKAKSITAIIEGLKQREEIQGLAKIDEDFAADVAEARKRYNAPRDHSAWD